MEPEVMVTCPLCRVTTSEKEIVDNLFLNPENSRNGEKDADMPETHMCESCDEGHFGNFQYINILVIHTSLNFPWSKWNLYLNLTFLAVV